jgi:POT family proton-dependent oligopeptide transporter
MILGLIQYKLGHKNLGDAGKLVHVEGEDHASQKKALRTGLMWLMGSLGLLAVLHFTGLFVLNITRVSDLVGILLLVMPFAYFGFLFTRGGFTPEEKKRIVAIIIFYLAAALFWSAFEQAGSTNLLRAGM